MCFFKKSCVQAIYSKIIPREVPKPLPRTIPSGSPLNENAKPATDIHALPPAAPPSTKQQQQLTATTTDNTVVVDWRLGSKNQNRKSNSLEKATKRGDERGSNITRSDSAASRINVFAKNNQESPLDSFKSKVIFFLFNFPNGNNAFRWRMMRQKK